MRRFNALESSDVVRVSQYAEINSLSQMTYSCWMQQFTKPLPVASRFLFKVSAVTEFSWTSAPGGSGQHTLDVQFTGGLNTWVWDGVLNRLSHWIFRYDNTNVANDPVVWVNGAVPSGFGLVTRTTGTATPGTSNMDIGGVPATARSFNGLMAEVAIWNRLLSDEEALNVMANLPAAVPSGRVMYLPLCGLVSPEPNLDKPANTGAVNTTLGVPHPIQLQGGYCGRDPAPRYSKQRKNVPLSLILG
jgi:concanavalin A-like lectin/glucanase superfamily protein